MEPVLATPAAPAVSTDERKLSAWIQLAALVCFAALAMPFFLGRVYVADDLGEFHLPVRNFYAEQLERGESFDWMPSLYGGFYVSAEGQLGAYHPLHYLLYRWLPLGAAFDIELLASYPLLFAGTYWFLKRQLGRRDAASFGALAFAFCGFNLLHFVHPNAIAIVAHIPWLLVAIDVALSASTTPRRAAAEAAIALLLGSQLLLGYPQYVWFSLIVATAFALWRARTLRTSLGDWARLVLAVTSGFLIGALQWVPTWYALSESVRSAPNEALANSGALHPFNLVQLLAPYLFETRVVGQNTHELGLYVGAVPLVLCLWLLAERRHWGRFRPLVRALIGFALFSLILAAGEHGGLYRLQAFVPLANRFRFPCRAIVLFQFSIAALAAVALALLIERVKSLRNCHSATEIEPRRHDTFLKVVFLASVALAVAAPLLWPQFVATPLLIWCGPVLIGGAAGLVALAERGRRGVLVALAVLTAVDLACYGLSYSVYGRTADLRKFVARIPLPPNPSNTRIASPRETGKPRTGDRMLLAGLNRGDGYAGLEPAKRLDYRTLPALQQAGVGWIWPAELADDAVPHWTAVEPTAPRARLVTKLTSDAAADANKAPLESATVDEDLDIPSGAAGNATVIADRPGKITIETDAPTRQLLVTTESFDSFWQAGVDGRKCPIVRVNGDFLGCVVAPGRHQVTFAFHSRALELGAVACGCGLELMLCTFWLRVRPPKRRVPAPAGHAASHDQVCHATTAP